MSEHIVEVTVHRVVEFDIERGDGRTLHTRIVPWDTPATVSDPPDYIPYQEVWARGAFDKQLNAANRVNVLMNFEHEQGIGGIVGRGVELRKEDDGLHGVFRMLNSQDADKALELVREEVLTGLSLEAKVKRGARRPGDIVVREDARLVNVALCRDPAYADARVLAVRQESVEEEPEEESVRDRFVIPRIPPLDVARLEALGMTVPPPKEIVPDIPSLDADRFEALGMTMPQRNQETETEDAEDTSEENG